MRPPPLAPWCLAAALLGGRPLRGLAQDGPGPAAVISTEGLSEPELRDALGALLGHADGAVRQAAEAAVLGAAPPERPAAPPWYCDPQRGYPYALFALELAGIALLVAAWETAWLGSSLALGGGCFRRLRWSRWGPPAAGDMGTSLGRDAKQPAQRAAWGRPQVDQFWAALEAVPGSAPKDEEEHDEVFFSRKYFAGRVGGCARIDVRRKGCVLQPLTVRTKAYEPTASNYAAKAGRDFQPFERDIHFAAGQTCQTFEIELPRSRASWAPTAWFRVELAAVVSGTARLGGPTVPQREAHQGPIARVYILQDVDFPPGAPEHLWSESSTGFRLMLHYLRMQRHARGEKWTKTLVGLCYDPIHTVVVTAFVKTWMLDWAANEDGPKDYHSIMLLVCLYILSTALNRWGDQVQTKNRGRTGAIRMGHRRDLFCKKMMLEHVEHCRVPAEQWFYVALQNVDVVTMDGYWQGFLFLQSVFALLLSITVILVQAGLHDQYTPGHTITFAMLFLLVPVAVCLSIARRVRTEVLLTRRMEDEAMWVDTWAWLTNAGSQLFSFGPREKARVEASFAAESKDFVGWHQKARDEMNDTAWIIHWGTATSYALILGHGGIALLRGDMTAGQFVLLLNIASSYSKYLGRAYESVVYLQRGSVSLKRLCRLMNLPEHKSLQEALGKEAREPPEESRRSRRSYTQLMDLRQLEFRDVRLDLPRDHDLGPLSALRLRSDEALSIPLGRVVRIRGGSEGLRYSFMALASGVVPPTRGSVVCPGDVWAIMMATTPMRSSHLTVLEALMLAGAKKEVAENLARALCLAADLDTRALAPGELQTLTLVRALLRDPDVLVASRPLSYVLRGFRANLVRLLRAWQAGGAGAVLRVAGDVTASIGPELALQETLPLRPDGLGSAEPSAWRRGNHRRTLLITDEDMGRDVDPCDVFVDLDEVVEVAPPSGSGRGTESRAPLGAAKARWQL